MLPLLRRRTHLIRFPPNVFSLYPSRSGIPCIILRRHTPSIFVFVLHSSYSPRTWHYWLFLSFLRHLSISPSLSFQRSIYSTSLHRSQSTLLTPLFSKPATIARPISRLSLLPSRQLYIFSPLFHCLFSFHSRPLPLCLRVYSVSVVAESIKRPGEKSTSEKLRHCRCHDAVRLCKILENQRDVWRNSWKLEKKFVDITEFVYMFCKLCVNFATC